MRVPPKESSQSTQPVLNNNQGQQFKYCSHCGAKIDIQAVVCPHCGVPVEGASMPNQNSADQNSSGLNVLSFFFPVVGWILWAVWHDDYPIKAHGVAEWAWIGFAVWFVIGFTAGASGD